MYKVGEKVIHLKEGLSSIDGIKVLDGKNYYIVHSSLSPTEIKYISIDNPYNSIRDIMNSKQAKSLLDLMKGIEIVFNPNTKHRRDLYRKKLYSGDVNELAGLYKEFLVYQKKVEEGTAIKFGEVDFDLLETARKLLLDELCISFKKNQEEMEKYIINLVL